VEMLGGTISAESEVGKGTTFTLRIGNLPPPA
jgi:signal transduction histidine kinase